MLMPKNSTQRIFDKTKETFSSYSYSLFVVEFTKERLSLKRVHSKRIGKSCVRFLQS